MTLYLLDASVLISAHEDYYPVDRIPPFWAWLIDMGERGIIKMPRLIFDEIKPPPGPLADWIKRSDVREALILKEPIDGALVRQVLSRGYAPDLDDVEVEEIGKDPFLIAAALTAIDRIVVTREVSKPSSTRANRRIPDVCTGFGIQCITDFRLYSLLKFSIP
jgi:hypothetical protein